MARFAWCCLATALRANARIALSPRARHALRQSLLARLSAFAERVADWEWEAFCATPGLASPGRGARAREVIFSGRAVEEQTLRVLRSYPELARLWLVQVESWLGFTLDFLRQAAQFGASFEKDESVGIRAFQFQKSDPHPGGGSTIKVTFTDGAQWFYKPRSGRWEKEWFAILRRTNRLGFPLPFAILSVVRGTSHCWMESLRWRPCLNSSEARRFYLRGGALLYLVHQLRGVDFHAANLIAHGAQPVFIDCETLLHGRSPMPVLARSRERSVCRTGILRVPQSPPGRNLSAFSGDILGNHRPKLRGRFLRASDFVPEIVSGFMLMHDFLGVSRRREAVFCEARQRRADPRTRLINRPTAHYYALLENSLSARCLRSSSVRRDYLLQACLRGRGADHVIADEVDAMMDGNVPMLLARAARLRSPPSRRALYAALTLIGKALNSNE